MTMICKIKAFLDINRKSRKLYVTGCGRSGTHWLGYILDSHPDVSVTIEKKQIMDMVKKIVLKTETKTKLYKKLTLQYRIEHFKTAPKNYADKSHPNLWLIEDLSKTFPLARFLAIYRQPYATVSSMLKLDPVRKWCEEWEKYPIPNRFLGITKENLETYKKLSITGKCAMRWLAHKKQIDSLTKNNQPNLFVIKYEDLQHKPAEILNKLQQFLELEKPFPEPDINTESLNKWKDHLTSKDIEEIQAVTGIEPPA